MNILIPLLSMTMCVAPIAEHTMTSSIGSSLNQKATVSSVSNSFTGWKQINGKWYYYDEKGK